MRMYIYTPVHLPTSVSPPAILSGLSFSINRHTFTHSVPYPTGPSHCIPPHFPSALLPVLSFKTLISCRFLEMTHLCAPTAPSKMIQYQNHGFTCLWPYIKGSLRPESVPYSVYISRTKHCAWHENKTPEMFLMANGRISLFVSLFLHTHTHTHTNPYTSVQGLCPLVPVPLSLNL